jgi:hypothetical protein
LIHEWVLVFKTNLEMTGSLIRFNLGWNRTANQPSLALIVEVNFLYSFEIVNVSLLKFNGIRRDVLLCVAHSTSYLRYKLILCLRGIVDLIFVA